MEGGITEFDVAPENCELVSLLAQDNIREVIFQEGRTKHWGALKWCYENGGVVVFFGIHGEHGAPYHFSSRFGFTWRFSSYTKYEFELTSKAIATLGNSLTQQQYSKSNLISAPEEDRWMVPKMPTMEEYLSDHVGYSDEATADEETLEEIKEAEQYYSKKLDELKKQCPLALHEASNGGKFIYLGFVNGDGNIPKFVRGAILGESIIA